MKIQSKLSLQWRVTLLTAIILIVCSVAITAFSMYNAEKMLYPLLEDTAVSGVVSSDTAIETGEALPSSSAEERKHNFDLMSVWFCVAMTVLGTASVWFVSGHALSPVKDLTKTVKLIDEHNLSERLPKVQSNDEIGLLTDSFNHMLSRLEEAFIRQKRFTASAAHELKTPLATVKAGMQVLNRDENATLQDYKENASMTIQSVDRLTSVVNDLLMIASAENGNQSRIEEINLDTMFDAIFTELSSLYEKNDICYQVDLQEKNITGNTDMLYRAFYNLVENAYKYNRKGGKIIVKSFSVNQSIYIEISDTGVGISKEHQPLVFEAFYRVDASRSRKTAGAGLGLSLVKAITERHGGTLQLESEPTVGSTLTMILPQ